MGSFFFDWYVLYIELILAYLVLVLVCTYVRTYRGINNDVIMLSLSHDNDVLNSARYFHVLFLCYCASARAQCNHSC